MTFWFLIIACNLYFNIEKGHLFYYLYLLVEGLLKRTLLFIIGEKMATFRLIMKYSLKF